jgi:hypothetical protein
MLVKDNQVTLRFTLTGTSDLHSSVNGTIVDRLQVTVGSTTSALDPDAASTSMVVNAANRTLQFTYTATSVAQHDFLLYLKKPDGTRYTTTAYTASVSVTDVYEFPTMSSVSKDIDVVTVGETLTCTSNFDSGVSDVTGVATITPTGYGAITASNVSISGTTYVYSFPVDYDVTYSGAIILTLGSSSITKSYSWATATTSFTLTGNHIYTFPSSFTHSGTLKEQEANTATLTFTGGDMLHSSVVATQIEYVKWNQGSDVTVSSSDLTCSDPLETITIANLTPTSGTTDLVFKVKLKAPDGTLSTEITHTVGSGNITGLQPETSVSFKDSLLWFDNVSYWDVSNGDNVATNNKLFEFENGKGKLLGVYANTDFTAAISTKGNGKETTNCSGTSCKIHIGESSSSTVGTTTPLSTFLGHDTATEKYMLQVYVFQMKSSEADYDLTSGFYATDSKCELKIFRDSTYGYDFGLDIWNSSTGESYIRGQRIASSKGGCVNTNKIYGQYLVVSYQVNMNHISTYTSSGNTGYDGVLKPAVISTCYGENGYRNFTNKSLRSEYGYLNSFYWSPPNAGTSLFWALKSDNLSSNVTSSSVPIINMQNVEKYMARSCYARSTEFTETEMKEINKKYMDYFGITDQSSWFNNWTFNNKSVSQAYSTTYTNMRDEASYIEVDCVRGWYITFNPARSSSTYLYGGDSIALHSGNNYINGIGGSSQPAGTHDVACVYKFPIPVKITQVGGHCKNGSSAPLKVSVCDEDYSDISGKVYTKSSNYSLVNRGGSSSGWPTGGTPTWENIPTDYQQESRYYKLEHGGNEWTGFHVGHT